MPYVMAYDDDSQGVATSQEAAERFIAELLPRLPYRVYEENDGSIDPVEFEPLIINGQVKLVPYGWTEDDDFAAFDQGWRITRGYRTLINCEHGLAIFATDEEAIEFVKQEAGRGSVLALKALRLHDAGLRKSPEPSTQGQVDVFNLKELNI